MALSLVAAEFTRRSALSISWIRQLASMALSRSCWRTQARNPLNYLIVLCGGLALLVLATGGTSLTLAGKHISVQSAHNLVHVAFILFFVRLCWWWRSRGRTWIRTVAAPVHSLAYWHFWPMALWFLLPKRLGYFLFYVSPANGANSESGFFNGLHSYWP